MRIAGGGLYLDSGVTAGFGVTSGSQSVQSPIAGPGGIAKTGAGTLTFTTANQYTGGTSVAAGTLTLGADGAAGTGAVTVLAGAVLNLDGATIGNAISIAGTGVGGAGALIATGSAGVSGAVTLTGDTTFGVANPGDELLMSGSVGDGSNGYSLTKTGAGDLELAAANTYGGRTIIGAGTLTAGNSAALGTGTVTVQSGATLVLLGNLTIDNAITLSGAGAPGLHGALVGDGGITGVLNGPVALASDASIAWSGFLTINGVVSGNAGLTAVGPGVVTLNAAATYTGPTTVAGGTLALGAGGSIGPSTGVNLSGSGAAFDISAGGSQTILGLSGVAGSAVYLGTNTLTVDLGSGTSSFAGSIQDTGSGGSLVKQGAGTLLLAGASTYQGGTTVSGGVLGVGNATALGSGVATVQSGATLIVNNVTIGNALAVGGAGLGGAGAIAATGNAGVSGAVTLTADTTFGVANAGDSLAVSGPVSGDFGVTKIGAGTLILSGTNTYSGGTTIGTGVWDAASTASLGSGAVTVQSGATLNLGGIAIGNAISLTGAGTDGRGALTGSGTVNGSVALNDTTTIGVANTGDVLIIDGPITGSFVLTKAGPGTLILDGVSTGSSGSTTVTGGTLEIGDASHPGAVLAGDVAVDGGATLRGHGAIGGDVMNAGNLMPGGSVGVTTVAGNYTQTGAGTLTIEITANAAAGPGIGYDQLRIGGAASLAGALDVIVDPGPYALGSRYTVLTAAGGRNGTFASVTADPVIAGYISPAVSYDPNDVFVTLSPTPSASGPPLLFNGGQQAPDMLTAMVGAADGLADTVLGDVCGPAAQRLVSEGNGCIVRPLSAGYRSEVWMRGLGGVGSVTGGGTQASFHNDFDGIVIGTGIGRGPITVGVGGGYLTARLNFSDGSGASQSSGLGLVYARYTPGDWLFDGVAAYGGGPVTGNRALPGTGLIADSNRGGDFAVVETRAAYRIAADPLTIEPRASLAYIHAGQAGFIENGAGVLDLAYADTHVDTIETTATIRIIWHYVVANWTLSPSAEAGIQTTLTGLSRDVAVADGPFGGEVSGASPSPVAGVIGIELSATASEAVNLFISYHGKFSANQSTNSFSGGLVLRF